MIHTKSDSVALEQGCYFNEAKAKQIIKFAHTVFAPQYLSGKFELLAWQVEFLTYLYGWRNKDGTRRFRTAICHCGKKNGKTLITSLLCGYELTKSEDASPLVVSGSVSKVNAGQVFSEVESTVKKLFGTKLKRYVRIVKHQKKLMIPSINAEFRSLASDGDRVQGYNCSLVLL